MTPQQLKALLPPVKTTESSNDTTTNNTEKLYNLKGLGIYFGKDPYTMCCYIKRNNIKYVESKKAPFGYHKYYRLKDFKNYKPTKLVKKPTQVYYKHYKAPTLFQRIKLLFGLYN
jgi:hypothetical protein